MKTNLSKVVCVCALIMLSAVVAVGGKKHVRTNDVYLMFSGGAERIVSANFELSDPGIVVSKGQPYTDKVDVECVSDSKGKGHVKLTLKAGRHQTKEVVQKFKDLNTAVWLSANHYATGSKGLPSKMNFFFTGILSLEVSFLDGRENVIRKFPLTFAQFPHKDLVGITLNNVWIVASKSGRMYQLGEYESISVPVEGSDTSSLIMSQHRKYYKGKYFYGSWTLTDAQNPQDDQTPDDQTPDDQDPTDG